MTFDIISYFSGMGLGLWEFFSTLPDTLERLSVIVPSTTLTPTGALSFLGILSGTGLFLYMGYTFVVHWILPG